MPPPKWKTEIVPSHKFEFINIPDFHSNSIWARLRYMWVWIMFFKTILVLCGDVWTCTILIISGSWTSDIQPAIEISTARWIFTGCILLSFLLLAMDFRKAIKVMRSEDISYAVSNPIVSGFYCLQKFDYFCFIEKIHNSSKLHDKLCFFVFFQLKGWKYLVVQAPRAVINIMTLVAFMKALGFDFDHLDEVSQILPGLKLATKFTFCVMVFTSLMFILSGLATLVAVILWVPLIAKVQGNLKEYVCHKMDKRIDNIIKKTTKERVKKTRRQQELEDKHYNESIGHGGSGNGGGGHGGEGGAGVSGGFKRGGRNLSGSKAPSFGGSTPRRPKPTLPDIDVILANAHEDIRLPAKAHTSQQQQRPQHVDQHTFQPHHSNQLHYQPRPHHHYTSHTYNPQHNQYAYHESPPFAHVVAANTSPYRGARRSLSSGRNAAGVGYHGTSQHHIATYQYHPSPPHRPHELPNRKQSLASAHSARTDEGSPAMYHRSLTATGVEGPPLSKAAQIARYYREQHQYQQSFQQQRQPTWPSQHPLQPSAASPQQLNQHLHPIQSQHYHDTRPHTPAMLTRAVSDGPENWPAHYGFATDASQTAETPSTVEQFSIYRPDSGVLPDQNDPYYRQYAVQKSGEHISSLEQHDESAEGSGSGFRSGSGANEPTLQSEEQRESTALDRRGSNGSTKAKLVYQPGKTELEHYDNLYKGITETHLRVKATRSMSVRSKSSRASLQSSSPEPSYARALRQQQQEQLLDQRGEYSQMSSYIGQQQEQQANSGDDNDSTNRSQDQDLPEVAYIRPPPPVLNQYHTSPSLSSSSTVSSPRDHHTRLVHHPSMTNLHQQYQQQQQQQLHHRFHSSSSLRSAYTATSPSSASLPLTVKVSSEYLRDKSSHSSTHPLATTTRDHYYGGKEELIPQHGFPVVVPPSPLPLDQGNVAEVDESFESGSPETAAIRIEDVLSDLTSSLGDTSPLPPPPSSMLPPNPIVHNSTGSAAFQSSFRAGTSTPRSRTPVSGILPPPPSGAPPMSTNMITRTRGVHDDNVKVEVFEDRNIKVEIRDGEEEEIEIKDAPRSDSVFVAAPSQEALVATPVPVSTPYQQKQAAFIAALKDAGTEEDDDELMVQLEAYGGDDDDEDSEFDDEYGYDRNAWEEDGVEVEEGNVKFTIVTPPTTTSGLSDRPPLLPSCPPPNFHPQEAESLLLMRSPQIQPKGWPTIKQQSTRLSSESGRRDTNTNTHTNNNAEGGGDDTESLMYLRTANTSKSSLASSIRTTGSAAFKHYQFYNHRSGTPPIPPVPSSPPPPVPGMTSVATAGSTTNLASALRKGMVMGSGGETYVPSRDSLDQVRTSVERATASASPRVESKLRMSSDREHEREQRF